jgi:hypothetical protein
MPDPRWQRVENLYRAALEREPERRAIWPAPPKANAAASRLMRLRIIHQHLPHHL